MSFPLTRYMAKLGLADVAPGAAGLTQLQEAQMRALPFANVEPLLGRVPDLRPEAIEAKLLGDRGGYCYEQNGLLARALEALGYAPKRRLARVRNGAAEGGARSHLCLVVTAEGEDWLVDAGFGGPGSLAPLRLVPEIEQKAPNGTYRLRPDREELVVERLASEGWFSVYSFDDVPARPMDIEAANYLSARWQHAPFPDNLMLAFYRPEGRVAAFNRGVTRDGVREVLADQDALVVLLCETCGLRLTGDEVAAIWAKIKDAPVSR